MKKILALLLSGLMCLTVAGCGAKTPPEGEKDPEGETPPPQEETELTKTEQEFEDMMKDVGKLPMSFVYEKVYHDGLDRFTETDRTRTDENGKVSYDIKLAFGESLEAEVVANFYRSYDAWDYTVYFSNPSAVNSGVIEYVTDVDLKFAGERPVLKGMHGDHSSQYTPYEYDLTEQNGEFRSLLGRATHEEMPYFNLEYGDGGALLAIGWGGTWQADFVYDAEAKETHYTGGGTVGLETYLKPGEKIRTALIAVVRYEGRDEDKAMNKWRRWMVDYVMPRDHAGSDLPAQPLSTAGFANDAGRQNSDGSCAEGSDSWQRSFDAMYYGAGFHPDFQWVDAGWYCKPDGSHLTYNGDWWGTVGSWKLDPVKWPGNTFRERVDYGHALGVQTLVWFEPERVTHIEDMVAHQNYKFEWALSDHGDNNAYLNNLGNPECLAWTTDRVLTMMEENDIDLYREDFNFDPQLFWNIGDGYQGSNRKGITENLYMQGHYALFDSIIAWGAAHGKKTFVDSCASGGGRNDLETLRRAVPFMRSDSDRTSIPLALAMRTRFDRWIPFSGRSANEATGQLATGTSDRYTFRANYVCRFSPAADYYHDLDKIDWTLYRDCIAEWDSVKGWLLDDFFVLTPQRAVNDDKNWTAYMYLDRDGEYGFLEAFRPPKSKDATLTVKLKGVDPDKYYALRDADGVQTLARVRGSALLRGISVYAEKPRTALLFYIEPAK